MRLRKLTCTFCGKTEDQVSKLVAGPRVFFSRVRICDECAALVVKAMEAGNSPQKPSVRRSFFRSLKDRLPRLWQKSLCRETGAVLAHSI
ncbi:MAG: hypothetical protein HY914_10035 [Desulfomonile tiedjei]|nr:hypothetical protein [Desulfomonile tiedjei]